MVQENGLGDCNGQTTTDTQKRIGLLWMSQFPYNIEQVTYPRPRKSAFGLIEIVLMYYDT